MSEHIYKSHNKTLLLYHLVFPSKYRRKVFTKEIEKQFEFDNEVANVFDDMIDRSVPFYKENLSLSINIIKNYLKKIRIK